MQTTELRTDFEYSHRDPQRSNERQQGALCVKPGMGDLRLEMWGGEHLYHISWLGTQGGQNTVAMMCVVVDNSDIPFHKWQFNCSYQGDWRERHMGHLTEVCQEIVKIAGEHVHADDHAPLVELLVGALMRGT